MLISHYILASILFLLSVKASADELLAGRVVGVSDGDTIRVLSAENVETRVRLAYIDAPEKSQAFGMISKQSLSDLVYGKAVTVNVVDTDKYGRKVGVVYVGQSKGLGVNKVQVQRGLAWVYRNYSSDQDMIAAEANAKAVKAGLWADPNPVPPWEYRHGEKSDAGAGVLCTQNVKQCSNGTWVGRIGPRCEFALCSGR